MSAVSRAAILLTPPPEMTPVPFISPSSARNDSRPLYFPLEYDDFFTEGTRFTPQNLLDDLAGRSSEELAQVAETMRTLPKGEWRPSTHSASARAEAYELQITGRKSQGYFVNGVEFDGVSIDGLIEAKGPGYGWAVKNGRFIENYNGAAEMANQARRQVTAAKGAPIVWEVAEENVAVATRALLADSVGLTSGIIVKYVPPLP